LGSALFGAPAVEWRTIGYRKERLKLRDAWATPDSTNSENQKGQDTHVVRKICGWCETELEGYGPEGGPDQPVSHGICRACARDFFGVSRGTPLPEFLASLDIPTFLTDGNFRFERANTEALSFVGKDREEVEGVLGGEVFECVNAGLPGGCGKTEKCSVCTVRNSVEHTHLTGESRIRVPSTLMIHGDGSVRERRFFLTTEKVGERVVVQVEPDNSE